MTSDREDDRPVTPVVSRAVAAKDLEEFQRKLREKAHTGRNNPAFVRLMRAALNGRTNEILHW
jgi:hypothetical protein